MDKKVKTYNLSKSVIDEIHTRAIKDDRKDSDWLNKFLKVKLITTQSKEIKKVVVKTSLFQPPSNQEVNSYAIEKSLNLKGFFDYYESNGWKVGKNKMKKWKNSASGWSSRQGGFNNQTNQDFSDESTDWVNQDHGIII